MNTPASIHVPVAALSCCDLTVRINGRMLVEHLDLALEPGDFVCMLGPNGVGKTLTLHTLAGLRDPSSGEVQLAGCALQSLPRPDIARRLGLLLQHHEDAFPVTVLETALMGRHAHIGFWQWESAADLERARTALADMDLVHLEQRQAASLSGGERRRLSMATLLVQNPDVLLLDEPMNHLDPLHRFSVLEKLQRLTTDGRTVLVSIHDPVLASRYADRVLLLYGDGRWKYGPTTDLLTAEHLGELYGTPFARYTSDNDDVLLPVANRPCA